MADEKAEISAELYRRGLMSPETKSVYEEMQRRGLFVASEISSPQVRSKSQSDAFVNTLDQAMRSIAQGITLGYGDQIAAKLESMTGIGGKAGAYQENLAAEQAKTAAIPSEIDIPGQIAGAVAGTVAGGPIVRGAGALIGRAVPAAANVAAKIPAAAKAALGGAAIGGIAGSSQGDAVTGAATGALTGGTLAYGGKLLGAFGDKILTSVIRPLKKDLEDGFSLDTIKKFDIGGSLNYTYTQTQRLLGELSGQLKAKLGASTATIDLSKVVDDTEKDFTSTAGKIKAFGSNKQVTSVLENLRNEVLTVGTNLSIPDAQIVKQASGAFGAWQYGRTDPDARASEVVFNSFYNKLKTAIEKASPAGVKEINKSLSELIPVNNALIRRIPVADRNYALSLGDLVTLATSVASPDAGLLLTGVNLAQKNPAVGAALSKYGPRLGRATAPASAITGLGGPPFLRDASGRGYNPTPQDQQ